MTLTLPIGLCGVSDRLTVPSGPYKLNGCPVRRVPQHLMVTTSLKIDISGVTVPANMDDKYFSKKKKAPRSAAKRTKDGDIFEEPKQVSVVKRDRDQAGLVSYE